MDAVQKAFCMLKFKVDFHSKRELEFQDWFVRIANYSFGADFVQVRPYGNIGDHKCDGYNKKTKTVFQCYAPYAMKEDALINKINSDLKGAIKHWSKYLNNWILVHNDSRGLPPNAVKAIENLQTTNQSIEIEVWTEVELRNLVADLGSEALTDLFGYAPTQKNIESLTIADIEPIIFELSQVDTGEILALNLPTIDKLNRNKLSNEVKNMMEVGRSRSPIVGEYFQEFWDNKLGERIAEKFRLKYSELKNSGLDADMIFGKLVDYVGFQGTPQRKAAVLAILLYYFDTCDIFEDPTDEEVQS